MLGRLVLEFILNVSKFNIFLGNELMYIYFKGVLDKSKIILIYEVWDNNFYR